jgi:hypothetical protein
MIKQLWEDHPIILSKYLKGREIECEEKWYELVDTMLTELEHSDPSCRVHQIKTKFGKLRVYAEMSVDKISIINKTLLRYEDESAFIDPYPNIGEPNE